MRLTEKELAKIVASGDVQIDGRWEQKIVPSKPAGTASQPKREPEPEAVPWSGAVVRPCAWRIVLDGEKAANRNSLYSGGHWSKRHRAAKDVHSVVVNALSAFPVPDMRFPVTITVIAHGAKMDSSNIDAKLYEDGLIQAGWLPDDSRAYVRQVRTESRGGKRKAVEIVIEEA